MKLLLIQKTSHKGGHSLSTFRITQNNFLAELAKIPGGYEYWSCASTQVCFPLKAGGELRFGMYDEDEHEGVAIDLYDGALPPGVTGPAKLTGK